MLIAVKLASATTNASSWPISMGSLSNSRVIRGLIPFSIGLSRVGVCGQIVDRLGAHLLGFSLYAFFRFDEVGLFSVLVIKPMMDSPAAKAAELMARAKVLRVL